MESNHARRKSALSQPNLDLNSRCDVTQTLIEAGKELAPASFQAFPNARIVEVPVTYSPMSHIPIPFYITSSVRSPALLPVPTP